VPLLTARSPLPHRPSRLLVAGTSGSGKTTVAARIGQALDVWHIEIDTLFHGPEWQPREQFVADVDAFTAQPTWVTEWQYGATRPLLAARADLLLWLDRPRHTVMRQVVHRTLRRRLRREVLWNGNVQPPLWRMVRDDEHIVRWAWRTHPLTAERVLDLLSARPEMPVVANATAAGRSSDRCRRAAETIRRV
jgi:adenylate kinase family enzyme